MTTSFALTLVGAGTYGYSDSAAFVRSRIRDSYFELQQPQFYFNVLKKALPALDEVKAATSESGWDGYHASPVTDETYGKAYAFLQALPETVGAPSVSADPDGDLTFEWFHSARKTLSISVSREGRLHYAALIGLSNAHGSEVFDAEIPKTILNLIQRVNG